MENFQNIGMMIFLSGLLGFLMYNKHLMVMLIMMEFMVLGIILEISLLIKMMMFMWVLLGMMFILVCESVIGLSSMILLSRSHSDDLLSGMSLIKC